MTNTVVKDIDWSSWNEQPESRLDLLYPERKRCRTCRRYFLLIARWQAYCSYECAGRPAPSNRPEDWPRKHAYGGREKSWFPSPAFVYVNERSGIKTLYFCDYCGGWHLGSRTTLPVSIPQIPKT